MIESIVSFLFEHGKIVEIALDVVPDVIEAAVEKIGEGQNRRKIADRQAARILKAYETDEFYRYMLLSNCFDQRAAELEMLYRYNRKAYNRAEKDKNIRFIIESRKSDPNVKYKIFDICEKKINTNFLIELTRTDIQQAWPQSYHAYRRLVIKTWIEAGLCPHCGGQYKGIFKKACEKCGIPKY